MLDKGYNKKGKRVAAKAKAKPAQPSLKMHKFYFPNSKKTVEARFLGEAIIKHK